MNKPYFSYDRAALLAAPRIPLEILADNAAIFQAMAAEMAETIQEHNAQGKTTVFICPVGPTGQYPYFVELVNSRRIPLGKVWFINMDEYLDEEKNWISPEDPLSFRGFMQAEVYDRIDPQLLMPVSQRVFPDPKDPAAVDRLIEELGGVDICFGGIGINGHVAFNEADESLTNEEFRALPTRLLPITPVTRTANAIGSLNGAIDAMPEWCITIGFSAIWHARKIRLGVFRDWHRAVVRQACYGEQSAHFPVTLLQNHPDVLLRLTEFVASLG